MLYRLGDDNAQNPIGNQRLVDAEYKVWMSDMLQLVVMTEQRLSAKPNDKLKHIGHPPGVETIPLLDWNYPRSCFLLLPPSLF